jgi:RimJ/RimL family protein N-acetyltransferase
VTSYWPLVGLRLRVGGLELSPARAEDLDVLGDLLPDDLEMNPHTPRPFDVPERRARGVALRQEIWKSLATWSPDNWTLDLVVRRGTAVIGMQELEARDFAVLRTVETASWLGPGHRAQGFGKLARTAVLALAFEGLGARVALTEAWSDNAASLGVTRALGYRPNGSVPQRREGQAWEMPRFRMDLAQWRAVSRPEVAIEGLEPCLPWFVAASG